MSAARRKKSVPKVGFVSLGCPKALVDSERILTQLRAEGYEVSGSYDGSDLVVVNTCGFIDDAVRESLDAIGEALAENGKVIVTGCLGAKAGSSPGSTLVEEVHPSVLAVTGPHATEEVMAHVHRALPRPHDPFTDLVPEAGIKLTPRHRPVRTRVHELARELGMAAREHDAWVRMHYVYPYPHVDQLVELMAEGLVLPYLDVPFQHAHPRILKLMKRPASGERNIERIQAWRAIVPDITVRSTFIAGFPGETEAEFESLLEFLREARLDRVGCFAYSPVDGATANDLPGALPEAVREARRERFMQVQAEISAERLQRFVGRTMRVLVDGVEESEDGAYAVGRTQMDAPEIDGVVRFGGSGPLPIGGFVQVRITGADEHDLEGEMVNAA
ncbi:MAG: radical SAM protein [Betaproteobacteria bacterium]|nr:radical SAM protein [Betaproteobacteria bacterium]